MSEPLTERELEIMTDRRAAAEIRELRERVADLEGTSRTASKRIVTQRDDNARLREYARHKAGCASWNPWIEGGSPPSCDCGLDDALKEPDHAQDATT